MCRLKIKLKLTGTKQHKFRRLIIIPRNRFINSKYNMLLGNWDTRSNKHIRYIILNIYLLSSQYRHGLTPNKKSLNVIYYYFIKSTDEFSNCYFSTINLNIS